MTGDLGHPSSNGHYPAGHGDALVDTIGVFRKWLHLPDPGPLLVVLATIAANRAPGDPVWLLVVGPPGGGKTEILGAAAGLDDVFPAATLTEASLLSGTPKKERVSGAKGGLLRQIGEFGIVLCKDFGSILSMHREQRASVLAALREIYDGAWTRHLGVDGGRTLAWEGKLGLIAGCTPSIDSHHGVLSSLGERFVNYRLPPVDDHAQAARALDHVGHEARMRAELATAVRNLFTRVPARGGASVEGDDRDQLVALASLAVRCRSAVERDTYSRDVVLIPEPEAPGRLALVLARLLGGLRAIGADDATAWQLVSKTALDSMPALRRRMLGMLLAGQHPQATGDLARAAGYPTQTARRALEDLAAHGVLERSSQGDGKADLWCASAWCRDHWARGVPEKSQAPYAAGVPERSGHP